MTDFNMRLGLRHICAAKKENRWFENRVEDKKGDWRLKINQMIHELDRSVFK